MLSKDLSIASIGLRGIEIETEVNVVEMFIKDLLTKVDGKFYIS